MIAKHGHVTLISWTIFFFFAVFLFGHADVCHGQYQVDTPITSVSITTPSTSYVYWAPSTPHNLHCTTSTDTDEEWVVNGECADWEDVSDSVTHWWSCNYGSFQYDDNVGTDVVYYSPASHNDTVTVYADDAYAPVSNNYLANDAAQSDSFEVYLSALIHIQVDSVNVEGTTLYVNQGEEIQFDAIKSGGAWPTGTPYWGGTAGLSGVATSKTKTFNTTGEFTVTASDGDTVLTVTVKVYDVEIKAADGVSSAPTWIKVGESENYYAKVNGPASPTPSFQWSESSAKISMTSTTSQTVTVTAGGTASTSENDQQIQVVATVGGKSLDAAYHNLTVKAFTANTAIQTSITSPSADIRWAVGSEHTLTGSGSDSDWEMPLNQAISDTVTLYWDNSGNGDFDETVGSSVDYTCPTTAGETDTITLYCDDDNYIQGGTRGDTNDALYDETEATDSVTITTVAIGHLQVNSSNVEGTTLYVRTGESITFNAIADPSTPWPDDCPEWSGWGLSGSGAQKVKTFTSAGEDTIMAECGTSSKSVTVKVYDVQIKESDGTSDPAEWIKISDSEQYKAVVSGPGGDSGSFQWSESSAKISLTSADQQTVTVNAGSTPSDSEGAEQISLVFTPAGGAALSAVTHNLSVYQVQIKASDGVSSPSAVITDSEQYKAVVSGLSSNLTYAWTVTQGDCISLENATSQTVTVLGEGNGAAQIQVTVSKDGTALDPVTHDLTVARYTEGSEITVSVTDPETSFVYFPVSTSQTVTASGSDSDWDVSANGGAGGLVSDSVTLYWTLETGEFPSGAVGTSVSYTSPTTAGETDLVTVYCDDDSEILGEERGTTNKALFAEEPPVSDTFEVMAVGVAHIQVDESNVDGTTLYVSKGESVTFDAIADPAVSWPSGYPVWSGAASGTEAGETSAEVQFNATGEVTVTASCGTSSKSVTVKVYEVVIKASDGTSAPVGEIEADGSEQYKAVVTGPGGDSGSFQWSESSEKIGLTSADQQTVTVNAGSTASASVDAEELSVVFTPSGGTALTAVTHDLTVVAVGHIEVDSSNVDGTTLSVMKGETVTFDAIADPSSASWPTGYPTWSGWGLSGTATQKVKTFTSTGQDTITVTCGTSSKSVVVTVYEVVIKASDGTSDPAEWMNINDTEQYKAVVTGPGGDSGSFQWSESSEKISLTSADQQTVTVNSGASASDSEDAEEISVVFTPTGGTALTAVTHDLTVYQVRIMASDGVSSPPEEVEITEQYKGVVSGLSSNLTYAWTLASGEEYVDLTNTTSQTVTVTTEANGTVQLQLTVSKDGTALDPAIHEFESVPYSVGEPITPITITTPSEDGIRWGVGTYWHTLVAEPYPVLDCDQDYEENWYYDACTVWWTATDGSFQNDDNIGTTVYYECPEDGQYVTLTVHGDDNYNGDPYYYDDEEVTDDREIVAVEVGSITVGDLDITDEYYCTDDGDLTLTAIPYPTGGWPTSEPEWYLQDGETFDYEHTGETWDPEFPAGGPYDVKVTCGTDYETADVIVMAVTVDTPSAMAVNDTQVITCNAIPNPGDIHDMVDACLYWTFTPGSDPAPQVDLEPYSTDSETALLTATSAGTGFVQVWYYAEGVEGGVCVSDSKPVTITGVGINEPAVGVVGEATEMSASGYPSGSTYTWSVDNGSDPDADAAGYFVGSGTTINTVSFTGTTAGTGFVKVTYGAVEDTAPLVVLNVTMLSGAQSLEKGDTVELSCNAVPDPEAIGGYLYWYVDNGESAKRADGKFEPLVANEQETMVFTATKAGTGLITVEYWYDSLHATDAVGLVVAGVTIDTAPLIFVKDKAESVSATAEPDGSSTEWYEWTVLPSDGTGDGDFIPEYGYEATANPTTFDPTDAGTGIVQVEYTYDGLASYTDTAEMVILEVDPTPTSLLMEVGETTVVDAQAKPDPSDVGGVLEWYIDWESDPAGDAGLDPEYSYDQETTLVTAVSFGTGNLMVEYTLGDKTAYGTVPITIGGVKIVTPTVIDLGVDDSTDLDSTAAPSGGTFSWSLVEGGSPTAGGSFDQSTDEDPTFTGTTAGTAMAKVEYSVSGKTYSDSILCTVREVEVTQSSSVIPIGEYRTFICNETPAYETSDGILTWSVIEGEGEILFTPDNDTSVCAAAREAGTTLVEVKYEGSGETQGYDTDQFECTVIKVSIDEAPQQIALGDTEEVSCLPVPELAVTGGVLTWKLLDESGQDVTPGGMFNPNNSSTVATSIFTASGVDTGLHRIVVEYEVSGEHTSDSAPVDILGDLNIDPALPLLIRGDTVALQALDVDKEAYLTSAVTWSIIEDVNNVCDSLSTTDCYDTALFTASSTNAGTCIVKCMLNANNDIYDTAMVWVVAPNIDVKRLSGSLVNESNEAFEGSITKVYVEGEDSSPETWRLDMANVTLGSNASMNSEEFAKAFFENTEARVELRVVGPSASSVQGAIQTLRDGEIVMGSEGSFCSLVPSDFATQRQWEADALETGTVDLALTVFIGQKEIGRDQVRISGIACEPKTGEIILVDKNGYLNIEGQTVHSTIASGLSVAGTDANVLIAPATYEEYNLVVPSNVLLSGLGGSFDGDSGSGFDYLGLPTISGENLGHVLDIQSSSGQRISGLNIVNGKNSNGYGGGIYIDTCSDVEIVYVRLSNNEAQYGGAIALKNCSSVYLGSNLIEDNVALEAGGGLCIEYGAEIGAGLNTIIKNTSKGKTGGGGVFIKSGPEFDHKGGSVTFTLNVIGGSDEDANKATNIDDNVGGGGILVWNANFTSWGNLISHNQSNGYGGGIGCRSSLLFINSGKILLILTTIQENVANQCGGGVAVLPWEVDYSATLGIDGSFYGIGGGMRLEMQQCNVDGNVALASGGGGLAAAGLNTNVFISGGKFIGNVTTGLAPGDADGAGMRIYNLADVVLCEGCTFIENVTNDGGGAVEILGRSTGTFTGCSFTGNRATNFGGAFYVNAWGEVYLKDCEIGGYAVGDRNTALEAYGGGISIRNSYGSLSQGTKIVGNKANTGGGFDVWGLENQSTGPCTIDCKLVMDNTVTVSHNYADDYGGAGAVAIRLGGAGGPLFVDPELVVNGTLFEYNQAAGSLTTRIKTSGVYFGDESDGTISNDAIFQHHGGAAITCANDEKGWTGHAGINVNHCVIRDNAVGILCDNNPDSVVIDHCRFWRNAEAEPKAHVVIEELDSDSDVDITNCEFLSTGTTYGIRARISYYATLTDAVLKINNNNITGFINSSEKWGVRALVVNQDGKIDAESNYWGDADGPYFDSGDPVTASRVSTGVDYSPFETSPVEGAGN